MNDTQHDALEFALETQLRAHYRAHADPAPADLWLRLAPMLDATPDDAHSAPIPRASVHNAPSATRASAPLVTLVRNDDDPADANAAAPTRRRPATSTRRSRIARGVASALSLVAALALVVGALALFHRAPGAGTGPRAIHTGALTWQPVALPAGVRLVNGAGQTIRASAPRGTPGIATYHLVTSADFANADLLVALSNGNVAYISEVPAKGAPLLWRTTDAGMHWTQLPSPPNHGYKSGHLIIDQIDPLTVIAAYTVAATPNGQTKYDAYALLNGSRNWLSIYGGPVTSDGMGYLASWHGVYYSTLITTFPNGFFRSDLLASADGMRSWHAIDQQIIARDRLAPTGETGIANFWVNPTTGALLAATYNETRAGELWMSVDHGANWSEVILPPSPVSEVGETNNDVTGASLWVQAPPVGDSFRLCAWFTEKISSQAENFYCSRDSGKTWMRRTPTSQFLDLSTILAPDGAGIGQTTTSLYLYPQDDTRLTHPRLIGGLPDPHGSPWDGARWGVAPRGVVFWAATNANVLYVAQYTLPDM